MPVTADTVSIGLPRGVALEAQLEMPAPCPLLVVFAEASGSSRHDPKNRAVAYGLRQRGLGTLLVDLLTVAEEAAERRSHHLRLDVQLLSERLLGIGQWLAQDPRTSAIPLAYFGASTGAAAALVAAARQPDRVRAVVSRGGRPDLAKRALRHVRAPTLLIVGGADEAILDLNRQAYDQLEAVKQLEVVPRATHLFEEAGTLSLVGELTAAWLVQHAAGAGRIGPGSTLGFTDALENGWEWQGAHAQD